MPPRSSGPRDPTRPQSSTPPRDLEDTARLASTLSPTDPLWAPRIRAELNPFHPHAGYWEVRTPIPAPGAAAGHRLPDLREARWHHAWFPTSEAAEAAAITTWQQVHARLNRETGELHPRTDRPEITWQYHLTYNDTDARHRRLHTQWVERVQPRLAARVSTDAIVITKRTVSLETPEPPPRASSVHYVDPDRSTWAPDDAVWDRPGRPVIQPQGRWMRGDGSPPAAWRPPENLGGAWHWARLSTARETGVLYRVDPATRGIEFWPDPPYPERPWQGTPEALDADPMAAALARAGAVVQSQEPNPDQVDPLVRETWWRWQDRLATLRAERTGSVSLPYAGSLDIETGDETLPTELTGFSWYATETSVHGQSTWFLWKGTEHVLPEGGRITRLRELITDRQGTPHTFARVEEAAQFAHNAGAGVDVMRHAEAIAAFQRAAADLPRVHSAPPSAWMLLPAGSHQAVVGRFHPDTGRLELAPKVERDTAGPPLVLSRATAEAPRFFADLCVNRRWGTPERHLDAERLAPPLAASLVRALQAVDLDLPPGLAGTGSPNPPHSTLEDPNAPGWRLVRPTPEARWIAVKPLARNPNGPVKLVPLVSAERKLPVTFGPDAVTPEALAAFAARHHLAWHPERVDDPNDLPPSWKAPMRDLLNRFRVRGPETRVAPSSPGAPSPTTPAAPAAPTLARP